MNIGHFNMGAPTGWPDPCSNSKQFNLNKLNFVKESGKYEFNILVRDYSENNSITNFLVTKLLNYKLVIITTGLQVTNFTSN